MSYDTDIAIILPYYNPPKGWEKIILDSLSWMQTHLADYNWCIFLVNDGSTLDLKQALSDLSSKESIKTIGYSHNKGKGHALRYGVERINAKLYILTDIDLPYQLDSILTVVNAYYDSRDDTDVWLGHRDKRYYNSIPASRRFISRALQYMNQSLLRLVTSDTQCGFKAFNAQARSLFLNTKTDGFLYDLEFVKTISRSDDIDVVLIPVMLRSGIELSSVAPLSLVSELKDFIRILRS